MKVTIGIRKSRKHFVIDRLVRMVGEDLQFDTLTNFELVVATQRGFGQAHGAYGGIYVEDKTIHLVIDADMSKFRTIEVLTHELIHVQQVASGRLQFVGQATLWDGEDMTGMDYDDRPWEHDAVARTPELIVSLVSRLV